MIDGGFGHRERKEATMKKRGRKESSALDALKIQIADWHELGDELGRQVIGSELVHSTCSNCLMTRERCRCPDMVKVAERTVALTRIVRMADELVMAFGSDYTSKDVLTKLREIRSTAARILR